MPFTKTDFRQFFDEIQMIRRRREFSSTWKEHLKGLGFRKAENSLEFKRKEYDHLYTNVLRKYGIVPNDLYADLDRLWNDAIRSAAKIFYKFIFSTVTPYLVTAKQYEALWDNYVRATIEHARVIGEGNLKDG
jgi:hypothetical protein